MLQVHTLPVGPLQANCYLVYNPRTSEAVVVDPGDEAMTILSSVDKLGAKVVEIWNTHGHFDHINANAEVKAATGAPISIHILEEHWLYDGIANLAMFAGFPFEPSKADRLWNDRDTFQALGQQWVVHHVPGHSPGMSAIACPSEKLLFSGDLLMAGSIGRWDFPGCSADALTESLRRLFNDWGRDDWRVYPGHGPATTVGTERRTNMLVKEALTTGL